MESFQYNLNQLGHAAKWVISKAENYKIIAFEGEVGTGKTTLIQIICKILDVDNNVVSPTYSLVNQYNNSKNTNLLYHFDFYRIASEQEAIDMGIHEYIESGNLCLIEWPQHISQILSKEKVIYIKLEIKGENERILTIN